MADNTVYLITGANRGIGLAVTTLLLTRPHTTVVATARHPSPSLDSFPREKIHPTSKLTPILLDDGAGSDPARTSSATLAARLRDEHGVAALDVVVANAGGSTAMGGVLTTSPEEMERDFGVNAAGPARLFQAVWPVMEHPSSSSSSSPIEGGVGEAGRQKEKKFVLITSTLGSIGLLDQEVMPGVAYGMSKAAANWFARKVSVELKGKVVVGVLHPGWVQTELGQSLADAIGYKQPPMTVEQCAKAVVEQIDNWTPEKSGQFLSYKGEQLPW
ncbi:hypothetical protein C8A01DRAFT_43021 [Parachaetomium inaequale]|uniref:Uncharacterized protein n=1 Tax=Parachaetomium inaequale TaxID=2588326 RepID=A0AAN6PSH4_9PEZI|nr:hypothetical protein C8A01DRAFT_43021 [Parachaetomium inaequale]